jgi:aminopeptidase N
MRFMLFLLFFSSTNIFSQQNSNVDFISIKANVSPIFKTKTVEGLAQYQFNVISKVDTIKIDAVNMNFFEVKINTKTVNFKNNNKALLLFEGFKIGSNILEIRYLANPKQTVYFNGTTSDYQIWTQGQGKETSHWLPSFNDVNEKIIYSIAVSADEDYVVLSNGILKKSTVLSNKKTWFYEMKKPMSSYLAMFAIGKFVQKTQKSKKGIILEEYLDKNDADKFETTYLHNKEIFDFLEAEIGFDFPWEVYRQVAVKDFLYGGMENTTTTIFSQNYVLDKTGLNDKSYVNVNAHELTHQWFGNLVTAKTGKHHWLQEGFATYYALLAEKKVFGDDYFNWKLYEMAEQLQQASKTDTIPILNAKASSLTFYQKGAWALHYLKTEIGDEKFKLAVKNYLKKYQFKNVETSNLLAEVSKISNFNVGLFQKNWLENPKFNVKEALEILQKNNMIKQYFEVCDLKNIPFVEKKDKLKQILESQAYFTVKQEVIYQLAEVSFPEKIDLLKSAMQSKNIQVRQAIAESTTEFPGDFEADYNTFLNDESYITKEVVLNVLWNKFPLKRTDLLEKTKNWKGFNDYNLRVLWLNLALRTKDYLNDEKTLLYDELLQLAGSNFETETRQNAMKTLLFLDKNDQNVLPLLVNGLTSYRWQMVKFCKDRIRPMLKIKNFRDFFEKLLPTLSSNENNQLKKLLAEK